MDACRGSIAVTAPTDDRYPTVTPYLLYEDVPAAIEWLGRAFGFEERLRFAAEGGTVNHAEMRVGRDGIVMLGHPGPDYKDPRHVGGGTAEGWGAVAAT
jgi:uncharacterized glyoxalase superfamily protein PhnB